MDPEWNFLEIVWNFLEIVWIFLEAQNQLNCSAGIVHSLFMTKPESFIQDSFRSRKFSFRIHSSFHFSFHSLLIAQAGNIHTQAGNIHAPIILAPQQVSIIRRPFRPIGVLQSVRLFCTPRIAYQGRWYQGISTQKLHFGSTLSLYFANLFKRIQPTNYILG